MKSLPQFVFIGLLLTTASCHDNNDAPTVPATAQFTQSSLSFFENDGQHEISLTLNIPASSDGQIILDASALASSSFITDPVTEMGQIKLPVKKGQAIINFNLSPVDNRVLDGCKVIKLSIASLSSGLRKGSVVDLIVSVNDDEAPAAAGFESKGITVRENAALGGQINVAFASPAPADGLLVVAIDSRAKYGTDYLTEPAAVNGKIFLSVTKGADYGTINVYPVNNTVFTADRNITLQIIDASGGLQIGSNNSFLCTITDDDGHPLSGNSGIRFED